MSAEPTETAPAPATAASHHAAFFRQSGWLMMANVSGGMMMYAVHFLAKHRSVTAAEYGAFGVMLSVAMCVPNLPLQMVFAQQTAQALVAHRERELAGMIRLAWLGTLGLCLLLAAGVLVWQADILAGWKLASPVGLWITVLVVLLSLWLPLFWGVLQGQQDFFSLGWSNIFNGAFRLGGAAALVILMGWGAAGMMIGVCAGLVVGTAIGIWQTRSLWLVRAQPFDWRSLLAQIVPLMLGFGAMQFLFTADMLFVRAYFSSDETGYYLSAGTMSRALTWLVLPLATVMFPKIVHSVARSEKSNLLGVVLLGTGILSAGGAVGLTVLGPWIIRLVYKASYVEVAAAVLPWYAWAMVPLSLAFALVNNLLARSRFRIVPVLVLLAAGYGFALTRFHDSLITVLKTLGAFNLLLFGACVWFTWGVKEETKAEGGS